MNEINFGRKGQLSTGLFIGIIIVVIILGIAGYVTMSPFFTQPISYADAWQNWAKDAFKQDDKQPWRMISLFFIPFFLYFGVVLLSLSFSFGALQTVTYARYDIVWRPVVVICIAISLMMLPSPFTYSLQTLYASLSPVLTILIFVIIIIGAVFGFYLFYASVRHVHHALPPGAPHVPAPPAPPAPPGLGAGPAPLPPGVRAALHAAAADLHAAANHLATI